MRPGPRLVVMALAFISGVRRSSSQQSTPIVRQSNSHHEDNVGFLAQINPWLSACDVANPETATDLQGQCSESDSILPKNWINEGPGPPECPSSCSELYNGKFVSKTDSNLKMDELNRFYEKQQCLEYLGDHKDSSPEQICKKSAHEISNKLRVLRLRYCCERMVYSSLHNEALIAVMNGGKECVNILKKIIDTDALASRITCGLNGILFRYDCRQVYSIKHGCEDCKQAYRRWVCSTLIPYFAEPTDIRHKRSTNDNHLKTIESLTISTSNELSRDRQISTHVEDPVVYKVLNRSKRKAELARRKRIRPCMKVCQTVEERCPYMLPSDRAPGYNTQYAGEPTFLCTDPNIAETGEQLLKSNNSPDDCCYKYCNDTIVYYGICSNCKRTNVRNSTTTTTPSSIATISAVDKTTDNIDGQSNLVYNDDSSAKDVELPPQSCQLVPGLSLTTFACDYPHYASSPPTTSAAVSIHCNLTSIKNKRFYYFWTISWILLFTIIVPKCYFAAWTNQIVRTFGEL